jgi:GTPase SAR1 family protein
MKHETISIFILGARSAGKTSFLAGLCILSQPNHESRFQLLPKGKRSAQFVTDLRKRVQLKQWWPGNVTSSPIDVELTFEDTNFSLSLLDYPGEDLVKAMKTMDMEERETIRQHLISADCILLLLDPTQDLISDINENEDAVTVERQNALATAISYSLSERKNGERAIAPPRIYPVITKSDLIGDEKAVKEVALQNKVLLKRLKEYANSKEPIKLSAISICGDTAPLDNEFPANPRPLGFDKIFRKISDKPTPPIYKIGTAIIAAILLIVILFTSWQGERDDTIIINGTLEQIVELSNPDQVLVDERLVKEIQAFEGILAGPDVTLDALKAGRSDVLICLEIKNHSLLSDLEDLRDRLNQRIGDGLLALAQSAYESAATEKSEGACLEYLETFPNGIHRDQITKIQSAITKAHHREFLNPIKTVKANSKSKVQSKLEKIEAYRQRFPDMGGRDVDAIERAIQTARKLIHADKVTLHFSQLGFSAAKHGKREVELRLYNALPKSQKDGTQIYLAEKNMNKATLDKDMSLAQSDWTDFYICLWDTEWGNEIMAAAKFNLFSSLPQFDGRAHIKLQEVEGWSQTDAWFTCQLKLRNGKSLEAFSQDDLEAYKDYIFPGNAW